jgi:hypothetical protein
MITPGTLLTGVWCIEFMADKSINEWAHIPIWLKTQQGYYGYDLAADKKYLRHIKSENPFRCTIPDLFVQGFRQYITLICIKLAKKRWYKILYIYGQH